SGLLFAAVPAILLIVMGFVVLFAVLGESRAVSAASVLRDWAGLAARDERVLPLLSQRVYRYARDGGSETKEGPETPFLEEIWAGLKADPKFFREMEAANEARFFLRGEELWLIRAKAGSGGQAVIAAAPVDRSLLDRVSRLVRADVLLSASNPVSLDNLRKGTSPNIAFDPDKEKFLVGTYVAAESSAPEPPTGGTSLWQRRFYFGMTHLDVVMLDEDGFRTYQALLILRSSIADIWSDVFSRRNPMGAAFLAGIVATAGLMVVLELLTLILGLRITKGITSAVKALHQGTRRVAKGDFDTKTVVENEDELGDLAHAFNEMAAAVKRGREEAVRRQTIERELFVAREIQERLLPHVMPRVPGFEISGTSLPSQHVGGDYFDFLEMPSGRLGIAIADVSGKGIPAALLMANLQASLHGQAIESGDAALIVGRINNLLARSTDANMFATFFYGILDRTLSEFTYSNAGHNPPLLVRAGGSVERLQPCGLILGFMMDQAYDQRTVGLGPGDILVLFTDGITEAVRPGESAEAKYFGEERLLQAILAGAGAGAAGVQKSILDTVAFHTGEAPQEDDITLVVIKRRAA
ncbi:MAG: SpoIIE family protein phosphatase, partial [Candidatus Aminicenantes bacterium]|nr:SpoIIE family protein phosphatase [Candidatus Aminicenantes bacterium]